MFNLKAVVVALVVGFSGTVSMAAVAAEKIAVIDITRAMFSSNMAQARLKEAETGADFVALRAKYESSTADLQSLAKEAESKRMTWSQEQALAHQKKMEYAKADAELAGRKIQAEQQQVQQKIMQEVGPTAQAALQEVVAEEGVTILLKRESTLLYSPESDLTAKVADRLNKKSQ
ncbi:MAG: OmpH family outer membrane protein [Porticoccaceae bacterium]|nr:OmpH family outer membrane protein [Porticoccaceae bacterium]